MLFNLLCYEIKFR